MSADVLRRAADSLREAVEVAASQPETAAVVRGVWLNSRYHVVVAVPVALAVADQLDAMAAVVTEAEGTPLAIVADGLAVKSLAVARAYLGESA